MARQRGNKWDNSSEPLKWLAKRWQQNIFLLNGNLISKLEKTIWAHIRWRRVWCFVLRLSQRVLPTKKRRFCGKNRFREARLITVKASHNFAQIRSNKPVRISRLANSSNMENAYQLPTTMDAAGVGLLNALETIHLCEGRERCRRAGRRDIENGSSHAENPLTHNTLV